MNIYDTKVVTCSKCGKSIGEIEYDAVVTLPKCGHYANL
jgi:DNA-directed RNA polymerase subunit RPC12/RpoP